MFRNYVKIALRNFLKHKGFSFINIFGLAIGVACCLLIVLYVLDEVSYDKHHEKADQIYRVGILGFVNNNMFHGVVTCSPMAQTLVNEYPEVTAATRLRNFGFPVFRCEDKSQPPERRIMARPRHITPEPLDDRISKPTHLNSHANGRRGRRPLLLDTRYLTETNDITASSPLPRSCTPPGCRLA